ncbi:MAG: glycoside hydrolase family 18 protein [Ktedonobacteraceae bacterium]
MHRKKSSGKIFSQARFLIPLLVLILLILAGRALVNAPEALGYLQQFNISQAPATGSQQSASFLKGKTASLSWIQGSDCQSGIQAYLQSAAANPSAALVGTGWVNPLDGSLNNGSSNQCMPGSSSMDNVISLIHSKGGMAYLTITMDTDVSWSWQQAATYIDNASTNSSYITPIINEVIRAHYDGVIMDLEGVDHTYPNIQQLFANYNQRVRSAMQRLHKPYGIALLHKLSDNDAYYNLNAFENWSLLGHSADFIVIMAVDQSYLTPGPTASVAWLNQLLAYALQTMPDMLPHIIWELPLYGNTWHWANGGWVFDGDITFAAAQQIVNQLSPSQIQASASNLQDTFSPHVVYTDSSGVLHSLWYFNGVGLYHTIVGFWTVLAQEPQFANSHDQFEIAVWWRTTAEPEDFWSHLDTLY